MRIAPAVVNSLFLITLSSFAQSSPTREDVQKECIASLSGFPADTALFPKPAYPSILTGITLEYFESGCYGNCPAFTLTISQEVASFQGQAYVRAKGKHTAKLSEQQFEAFLHVWYDSNFYAMRDSYCNIPCPDGTLIFVTDIPESSIKMVSPGFTKLVFECFSTVNNQPQTPRPPEQYFELARQFRVFAKAKRWL